MDMPDAKGVSKRTRLEKGQKKYPDAFDYSDLDKKNDIPFPRVYKRAYDAWIIIASVRHEGKPVDLSNIRDYIALYGVVLSPYEIDCILYIDRGFLKYSNKGKSE